MFNTYSINKYNLLDIRFNSKVLNLSDVFKKTKMFKNLNVL